MNLVGQLLQYPIAIHDAGMLPTPAAHLLIKKNAFQCCIVISASHNGYQDNGIKIIDAVTDKIGSEHERFITSQYNQLLNCSETISFRQLGSYVSYTHADDDYIATLTSNSVLAQPTTKTIVIDSGNGACSSLAEKVFKHFSIDTINIHNNPDGTNINRDCGATHPESMIKTVIEHKAFLGFSFDGDGDRIVMADANGKLYTGDEILALLTQHPYYQHETYVVGTLMSNLGFEQWLTTQGKTLVRAQVGDKHVIDQLTQHNALLGGEPSGHIILKDHLASSDAIFTALFLTLFLATHRVIPGYTRFPQKITNVPTAHPLDISSQTMQIFISNANHMLNNGRIIVRNSGTESCVRIMVEDADADALEKTIAYLTREIKNISGKETI